MYISVTPGVYAVYSIRGGGKATLQLAKSKHGTARNAADEALVYAHKHIESGDLLFCAKLGSGSSPAYGAGRPINSNGEKCLFTVGAPPQPPKLTLID